MDYTSEDLAGYQLRARRRRFLETADACRLEPPAQLKRSPSFDPFDGPPAEPVPADVLESVLALMHDPAYRAHPSAGALYPVSILAEQRFGDRTRLLGLDPHTRTLQWTEPNGASADDLALDPTLSCVGTRLWMVANLDDVTAKYGPRGYRYALIEAGHVTQTLIQLFEHAGADSRPFGGFDDRAVAEHLGLAEGLVPLYALGVIPRVRGGAEFVEAEEVRCLRAAGVTLYYATAHGPVATDGRESGFGLDVTVEGARIRARGELAERLALCTTELPLGNSNGMAAHRRFEDAADAAVLELYERHCYLRHWLTDDRRAELNLPDTPLARAVGALARSRDARIRLLDISDPAVGVPAVMAVVFATDHGGVITASAASATEAEAAAGALREIAKALFYRLSIRKAEVFEPADPIAGELAEPADHEARFAHAGVERAATLCLTETSGEARPLRTDSAPLDALRRAAVLTDLSASGPDDRAWKVAHATSEHLLVVDFCQPTARFRERAAVLLGMPDVDCRWPHPLG